MAGIQNFRSALNGFNRQDVVSYIEYMNHKHNLQVEQLNTQLQAALAKSGDGELQARLEAAEARIQELEAAQGQAGECVSCTEQELEAYRRAERTERQARERAELIQRQANAILSDVTFRVNDMAAQVVPVADDLLAQLKQIQDTVTASRQSFQDAVVTLNCLRSDI